MKTSPLPTKGFEEQRCLRSIPYPVTYFGKLIKLRFFNDVMKSQWRIELAATGYTAVIRQDGPWWIGWIEEIPGVNCQGETREELIANLRTFSG